MNLLSRGRGQEIDRLELEFISYNIQELSLKVWYIIYISYISVDCFFSRYVLSGVGLHHSIINILAHCCIVAFNQKLIIGLKLTILS